MTTALAIILACVATAFLADLAIGAWKLRARVKRERKRGRTHA